MVKAICIVGLPGSGKTYLANELKEKDPSLVIIDDMITKPQLDIALHFLSSGTSCILIDTNFCSTSTREVAEHLLHKHKGVEVEWVFFENDAEKCRRNVEHRRRQGDPREVEGTIKRFEKKYEIPKGIVPKPIWNDKQS